MTTDGYYYPERNQFTRILTGDVVHYAPWRPVVDLTHLYQCPDCSSSNVLVDHKTGDYVCPVSLQPTTITLTRMEMFTFEPWVMYFLGLIAGGSLYLLLSWLFF